MKIRMDIAATILAFVVLISVAVVTSFSDLTPSLLMRDPTATGNLKRYTGIVSNLGIISWTVSSAIAVFFYLSSKDNLSENKISYFMLAIGAFSILLLLDDLLLFHEHIFIGEKFVFALYIFIAIYIFTYFREVVRDTKINFLAFSVFMFSTSIGIDVFKDDESHLPSEYWMFLEDGTKFLGIVFWTIYICTNCSATISRMVHQPRTDA